MWYFNGNVLWTDKIEMTAKEHQNFKLEEDHSIVISDIKSEDSGFFKCSVIHGKDEQSATYNVQVAGNTHYILLLLSFQLMVISYMLQIIVK